MNLSPSQRLFGAFCCGLIYTAALVWAEGYSSLNLIIGNLAHMSLHMAGLVLAMLVDGIARKRPAFEKHIKGVGALLSLVLLAVMAGVSLWKLALGAYSDHDAELLSQSTQSLLLAGVAALGLVMHLMGFWLLRGGKEECVNVRGAYIHLRFDLGLTAFTLVAGVLMYTLGWAMLDQYLWLLIVVLVLYSFWEVVKHVRASWQSGEAHHHHHHH